MTIQPYTNGQGQRTTLQASTMRKQQPSASIDLSQAAITTPSTSQSQGTIFGAALVQPIQKLLFDQGFSVPQAQLLQTLKQLIGQPSALENRQPQQAPTTLQLTEPMMQTAHYQVPLAEITQSKTHWQLNFMLPQVQVATICMERFEDRLILHAATCVDTDQTTLQGTTMLLQETAEPITYFREVLLGFIPEPNSIRCQLVDQCRLEVMIQKPINDTHYEQFDILSA